MSKENRKEPRYRMTLKNAGGYWSHKTAIDTFCREHGYDFVVEMTGISLRFFDPGVSAEIQALLKTLDDPHG